MISETKADNEWFKDLQDEIIDLKSDIRNLENELNDKDKTIEALEIEIDELKNALGDVADYAERTWRGLK